MMGRTGCHWKGEERGRRVRGEVSRREREESRKRSREEGEGREKGKK